ncbi:MAG: RluA family pseudouridine synthase [Eubacterium sp.]|nr:RluA family pseudouridine synthase [Eubacterium sp.]
MKEFVIKPHEAGQKLDKYLAKVLSEAPKSFLYKMLRKKNIVLNDKKADGHEVLAASDSIKIYFSDETFEKFANKAFVNNDSVEQKNNTKLSKKKADSSLLPTILFEDEHILLLNKPAGLLSQKAKPEDYSANDFVIDYMLESGQLTEEDMRTFKPSICNRLDRNTSGLLIAGKTMVGLQKMAAALKDRDMEKYYLCLVKGKIKKPQHLKGYLLKDEKSNKVTVKKEAFAGADSIETSYEPVEYYGDTTLLLVHLITGRSHQIRAHLASIGHPILGDYKYGEKAINDQLKKATGVSSQLLHAYRLVMPDGNKFEAPLPGYYTNVIHFYTTSED